MPLWIPQTESDIQLAIDERNLTENQFLDVKELTGDSESQKRETAKDLASFSIDGGVLLIGVREDKENRTFELTPIDLNGAPEKVNQIAAQRIDPPLNVHVATIESVEQAGLGYLVVEIPPSPNAPHMVDGRYHARADKTTRRLTDAEVARLHTRRRDAEDAILELLDDVIKNDPAPDRGHGHLYLVAKPVSASRSLARALARNSSTTELWGIFMSGEPLLSQDLRAYAPSPRNATSLARRSQGGAITTIPFGARKLPDDEVDHWMVDLELREDGSIHGVTGHATDELRTYQSTGRFVIDGHAVAYAVRLAAWSKAISDQTGHRGQWMLGMALTGLNGTTSSIFASTPPYVHSHQTPYDADEYRGYTVATYFDLADRPHGVAEELVGGLLRGLGTSHIWADHLVDQPKDASA